jgi:lipopolysaccharide transport system permease protein
VSTTCRIIARNKSYTLKEPTDWFAKGLQFSYPRRRLKTQPEIDQTFQRRRAAAGTTILRPQTGWRAVHFGELWEYRELLLVLAMRDIRVRYKQTVLGVAWAVIIPLLSTLVFVAFFSREAPRGVAAPVFFFSGLLPWQLFVTAMSSAGNSLLGNQSLITKVYFPRLVIPISAVVTALVDFAIASLFLAGLLAYWHIVPGPAALLLPLFIALGFLAALAVGLWLSAMNVEFRDIRYVLPFFTQFLLFVTPVIFPYGDVQVAWKRVLLSLNPMSGVVEGFRWCLLGTPLPIHLVVCSVVITLGLLGGGLFYFRRMEKNFADVI